MDRTIDRPPRRFHLVRSADPSGVSGIGVVAEGAEWSSGVVALHWPGHPRATSVWASIRDLEEAHGHDGATLVRWLDEVDRRTVIELPDPPPRDARGWPVMPPG